MTGQFLRLRTTKNSVFMCIIYFNSNNDMIECIDFPNHEKLIVIGYEDDTSLFPKKYPSIIEINNVIVKFENATGAELNRDKKLKSMD